MIVRDGPVFRRVKDSAARRDRRTKTIHFEAAVSPAERASNITRAMLLGLPSAPAVAAHDRTMVLACYGPSLARKVDDLAGEDGDLFTVSGAHDFLIERSVIPSAHVESDPRPHKAKMLTRADARVAYLIASCCSQAMFDAVAGMDVTIWHNAGSREEEETVQKLAPDSYFVLGGTTVASRAISLGSALGYRRFVIYGMDASFDNGAQHAGDHPNEAVESDLMLVRPQGQDRQFSTSAQMMRAVQDFAWQVGQMPGCEFTLVGDGLLQTSAKIMNLPRCTVIP